MANEIIRKGRTIPYTRVQVADNPNLTLTIIEYTDGLDGFIPDNGYESDDSDLTPDEHVERAVAFGVDKNVMRFNSKMLYNMLGSNWRETRLAEVELFEDTFITAAAMKVWIRHFHDKKQDLDLPREDLWHIVASGKKYALKPSELNAWFAEWYKTNESNKTWCIRDCREMMYPCFYFDHAAGFARATKYLAYNMNSHITELNPTRHCDLHLYPRCIQQVNSAKGRLRIILHSELWKPINGLLMTSTCNCKEKTVYGYQKALVMTGAWPLEQMSLKHSISSLLTRLEKFDWKPDPDSCVRCQSADYKSLVAKASQDVRKYFDGLCLVCMEMTNSRSSDVDEDYWIHNYMKKWDHKCKEHGVTHGQATWYHSFMGRKQQQAAREPWYQENRFKLPPRRVYIDSDDSD